MNVKELVEAVEQVVRLRSSQAEEDLSDQDVRTRMLVADAFTNPATITRKALEALGFSKGGRAWGGTMFWDCKLEAYFDGDVFDNMMSQKDDVGAVFPQPQTMGDVAFLLWQLSRSQESPQ